MVAESVVCWIKDDHKHWLRWSKPTRWAVSKHQPKGTRFLAMPRIYLKPPVPVDGRSKQRRYIQVRLTIEAVS